VRTPPARIARWRRRARESGASCYAFVAGLAQTALLVAAFAGCGGGPPTRTVTVERPSGPETSTTARRSELSRQDSQRVAEARLELRAYCIAVQRGEKPSYDREVAALATLITIFMRDPFARFEGEESALALAELLKFEADQLDDECDPKGARLLREIVDVGVYARR
jgi:hypothetical protein